MKHFFVFGSHPELSLAEAESVTGSTIERIDALGISSEETWNSPSLMARLGGCTKLGDVVYEADDIDEQRLAQIIFDRPARYTSVVPLPSLKIICFIL